MLRASYDTWGEVTWTLKTLYLQALPDPKIDEGQQGQCWAAIQSISIMLSAMRCLEFGRISGLHFQACLLRQLYPLVLLQDLCAQPSSLGARSQHLQVFNGFQRIFMFSVDPTAGKLVLLPSSSMEGLWRLLFWLLGSGKAGKGGQTNPDCLWNQYSDIPSPTLKQGTGKQSTRTIFKIGMGTGKDSLMHLAGLIAGGQGHKGRSLLCGSVRSLASLECWQAKEYTFQTKSLWQKSAVKLSAWEGRRDRQKTQAMWPTEVWHALSCRFRPDYLVHVCIGSIGCIDASCTHFFFLKTSWPLQQILLQVIWQQSSPKTSTKLPCLPCLWSSPQIGSLCPWTRRSLEGFSQDWFQIQAVPVVRKGGKGSNGTHLNHNRFRLEGFITIPEGFAFSLAVRLIQKETLKPATVALCMCLDPHCSCQWASEVPTQWNYETIKHWIRLSIWLWGTWDK